MFLFSAQPRQMWVIRKSKRVECCYYHNCDLIGFYTLLFFNCFSFLLLSYVLTVFSLKQLKATWSLLWTSIQKHPKMILLISLMSLGKWRMYNWIWIAKLGMLRYVFSFLFLYCCFTFSALQSVVCCFVFFVDIVLKKVSTYGGNFKYTSVPLWI